MTIRTITTNDLARAKTRVALMRAGFTYAQAKALAESRRTVFIVPVGRVQ